VTNGTLTLSGTAGLLFTTGTGTADSTMTFTGTTASINAALDGVAFAPNGNYTGPATLTLDTSDGVNADSDTVAINVIPVNDAPVADDESFTIAEDTTSGALDLLTGDIDADGDPLSIASINGTVLTPGVAQAIVVTNGTVNVSAGGVITFTPALNYNGPVSFDYVVSDGNGGTDTGTVNLTVTQVNDPASFGGNTSGSGVEDAGAITGTLTVTDPADGMSNPNYTVSTVPANGTASIDPVTGAWSYTPNADFNGSDSITVSVTDDDGNIETQVISITVSGANDAPVAGPDVVSTVADQPVTFDVTSNDIDVDGDALFVSEINGMPIAMGSPVTVASGTFSLSGGALTFTPAPGYVGSPTFTYTVSDGNGGNGSGTLSLTVSPADNSGAIGALDTGLPPDFEMQPEVEIESASFGGSMLEGAVTPTEFVLRAVNESLKLRGAMMQRMSGAFSIEDVGEMQFESLVAGQLVDRALFVLPAVKAVQLEMAEAQTRAQQVSGRAASTTESAFNDLGGLPGVTAAAQVATAAPRAAGDGGAAATAVATPAGQVVTRGAPADDAPARSAGAGDTTEPAVADHPARRLIIGEAQADDASAFAAEQRPRALGTASFAALLRQESAKLRADPFAGGLR